MCAECSGVIVSLNHTPTRHVSGDTREPHAEETHNSDDTPTSGECCRPGREQTLGLDVLMFKHFLFGNLSLWLMPQRIRTPESKMKVSIWGKNTPVMKNPGRKQGHALTAAPSAHYTCTTVWCWMWCRTKQKLIGLLHRLVMLMPHLFLCYIIFIFYHLFTFLFQ